MTSTGADGGQGGDDPMVLWVDDWEEGAPWLPWASHDDPVGTLAARRCKPPSQ